LTKVNLDFEKDKSLLEQKLFFSSQSQADQEKTITKLQDDLKSKLSSHQSETELRSTAEKLTRERDSLNEKYEEKRKTLKLNEDLMKQG
jgi:hypothetical protein